MNSKFPLSFFFQFKNLLSSRNWTNTCRQNVSLWRITRTQSIFRPSCGHFRYSLASLAPSRGWPMQFLNSARLAGFAWVTKIFLFGSIRTPKLSNGSPQSLLIKFAKSKLRWERNFSNYSFIKLLTLFIHSCFSVLASTWENTSGLAPSGCAIGS